LSIKIKAIRLREDAILPAKAHEDDAGYDLFANQDAILRPGQSALLPTGIAIELPPMTEAQIRPRSGLALRERVSVLNAPGTIDAGYRGEIGVILINHGDKDFVVAKGMKIAQMVICQLPETTLVEVTSLSDTSRGGGGFGSTGL